MWKKQTIHIHCKTCMYATMDRFSPVVISIIISNFFFFIYFLFVYWERTTIIFAMFLWCFKVGSDQVPTDWLANTDWLTNQLSDWLVKQLTGWLAEWFTNWLTQLRDGGMDKCTERRTDLYVDEGYSHELTPMKYEVILVSQYIYNKQ